MTRSGFAASASFASGVRLSTMSTSPCSISWRRVSFSEMTRKMTRSK